MRRYTDPLALDPLSPIGIHDRPPTHHPRDATPADEPHARSAEIEKLACEPPLVRWRVDGERFAPQRGVTPVRRTGHLTGDPPGRDALGARAALSS